MCDEDEQGNWKSVLGALCAASAILTIVGNLVVSPQPSQLPALNMAHSGSTNTDRSISHRSAAQAGLQAGQARRIKPATAAEVGTKIDDKVVTAPDVGKSQELPKSPCDSTGDIAAVEPLLSKDLQSDEKMATGPVDLPSVELSKLPDETDGPLLVAEKTPVVERASLPEQAPPAGDPVGSLPIAALPIVGPSVEGRDLPAESSPAVAADGRPAPPVTGLFANRDSRAHAVAVENSSPCFVMQKLSHYERKLLRRIAHLEKKKNRLFKNDCTLVCR
jgi:hypothetical protein